MFFIILIAIVVLSACVRSTGEASTAARDDSDVLELFDERRRFTIIGDDGLLVHADGTPYV